jgi:hypothetical protein
VETVLQVQLDTSWLAAICGCRVTKKICNRVRRADGGDLTAAINNIVVTFFFNLNYIMYTPLDFRQPSIRSNSPYRCIGTPENRCTTILKTILKPLKYCFNYWKRWNLGEKLWRQNYRCAL